MIRRIIRRMVSKTEVFLNQHTLKYRVGVIIAIGYLFYIHYG